MKWPKFEDDPTTFPYDTRYRIEGQGGVAWKAYGWEIEPDQDTEWTGQEVRTGKVVAVMVGDDHRYTFDPGDLIPIGELDYCAVCGQIGCPCDGRDRS